MYSDEVIGGQFSHILDGLTMNDIERIVSGVIGISAVNQEHDGIRCSRRYQVNGSFESLYDINDLILSFFEIGAMDQMH